MRYIEIPFDCHLFLDKTFFRSFYQKENLDSKIEFFKEIH